MASIFVFTATYLFEENNKVLPVCELNYSPAISVLAIALHVAIFVPLLLLFHGCLSY